MAASMSENILDRDDEVMSMGTDVEVETGSCCENVDSKVKDVQIIGRRLNQRERQVALVKDMPEYKQYIATVLFAQRSKDEPHTPDPNDLTISTRGFRSKISTWKRALHRWKQTNTSSAVEMETLNWRMKQVPTSIHKPKPSHWMKSPERAIIPIAREHLMPLLTRVSLVNLVLSYLNSF